MKLKIPVFALMALGYATYYSNVLSNSTGDIMGGVHIEKLGKVNIRYSDPERNSITLYWRGKITQSMGKQMVSALRKYRRKSDHFIIDISSPGGYVHSGEELIRYLKKMKGTHKIDTRVPKRGECLSMCVPIFLNGENRYAATSSKFMFHRPWVEERKFGNSAQQKAEKRRYKAALNSKLSQSAWRFYNVHFRASPIDRQWLKQLNERWKVKGKDYWTNGEKLMRENSNVITQLI